MLESALVKDSLSQRGILKRSSYISQPGQSGRPQQDKYNKVNIKETNTQRVNFKTETDIVEPIREAEIECQFQKEPARPSQRFKQRCHSITPGSQITETTRNSQESQPKAQTSVQNIIEPTRNTIVTNKRKIQNKKQCCSMM